MSILKTTCVGIALLLALSTAAAAARVKDLASIDGARDNQLIGFGLVGGLAGSGDDPKNAPYTAEAIANMLSSFGMTMEPGQIRVKNFAAVMITADLPPFVNEGDRLDISVSSVGSAKSLEGGVLYQTLLRGADGNVYAVAQGELSLGSSIGGAGRREKKHMTLARIPGGALVEREVTSTVSKDDGSIELNLREPDYTTASRIALALNESFGAGTATASDAGKLVLNAPPDFIFDTVGFIAAVENTDVEPGSQARVVINERTGTVVVGGTVEIMPVVITHKNMTLSFGRRIGVLPEDDSSAPATTVPGEEMSGSTTAMDVAAGLAAMGLPAEDVIAVFQAIESAGALVGELELI